MAAAARKSAAKRGTNTVALADRKFITIKILNKKTINRVVKKFDIELTTCGAQIETTVTEETVTKIYQIRKIEKTDLIEVNDSDSD